MTLAQQQKQQLLHAFEELSFEQKKQKLLVLLEHNEAKTPIFEKLRTTLEIMQVRNSFMTVLYELLLQFKKISVQETHWLENHKSNKLADNLLQHI